MRGQESVRSSAVKVALFGLLSVAIVLTIAATIRPSARIARHSSGCSISSSSGS